MAKKRARNVQMGWYDASGFHPIRASRDYDPDGGPRGWSGDYFEGGPRRRAKSKKKGKRKNPIRRNPLPVGRMVTVKARRRKDGKIDLYAAR